MAAEGRVALRGRMEEEAGKGGAGRRVSARRALRGDQRGKRRTKQLEERWVAANVKGIVL